MSGPSTTESPDTVADVHPSKTILTSMSLYIPLFLIGVILFEILQQTKAKQTFRPRIRDKETKCPVVERSYGLFGWIIPVLRVSEDEIFQQCGLDTLVFLRLMRMGQKFAAFGIFMSIFLFPIYATGMHPQEDLRDDIDPLERITMSNLSKGEGRLWASIVAMYLMTAFAFYLFNAENKVYVKRRHEFLARLGPQQYTVVVNDLPKQLRITENLRRYMQFMFPKTVHSIHVAVECKELENIIERRLEVLTALEHALAVYNSTGKRPTHKGKGVICVQSMDSIQFYQSRLERLNGKVAQQLSYIATFQKDEVKDSQQMFTKENSDVPLEGVAVKANDDHDHGDTATSTTDGDSSFLQLQPDSPTKRGKSIMRPSAFVSFTTLKSAHAAQQLLQSEDPATMQVGPGPHPKDIVWKNIGIPRRERIFWQHVSTAITVAIILFWTIPSTFIASLATVERLSALIPGLEEAFVSHPWLKELFKQGSPLGLMLMSTLAVVIFELLSEREGHSSQTQVSAALFTKLVYFQTIQIFFISIIAGTLFESLNTILKEPQRIVSLLGTAIPGQATTFMAYLVVQLGIKLTLELLRVVPIAMSFIYSAFAPSLTRRERETPWMGIFRPSSQPGIFLQAPKLPNFFLVILLIFTFCAIAPLMTYFAALFFCMADIIYRRQAMFVYDPATYSAGVYWPKLHDCLVGGLLLAQVTFLGLMTLKVAPGPIFLATVLPFFTVFYFFQAGPYWRKTVKNLPLTQCCQLDGIRNDVSWEFLDGVYTQPALKEKAELEPELPAGSDSSMGLNTVLEMRSPSPSDTELLGSDRMSGQQRRTESNLEV